MSNYRGRQSFYLIQIALVQGASDEQNDVIDHVRVSGERFEKWCD